MWRFVGTATAAFGPRAAGSKASAREATDGGRSCDRASGDAMTGDPDTGTRAAAYVGAPGCDTGPASRVAFVAHELADLWREVRDHARPASDPDIEKDTDT